MIKLIYITTLLVFYGLAALAQKGSKNYAIIINGGGNNESNHQRYFENVHAIYDGFRGHGIPSEQISVLYGSGKVEDTNSSSNQPQFTPIDLLEHAASSDSTKASTPSAPSTITLDYLFSGEQRLLDGGANSQTIKKKFRELREKLKPGDNVTLYITDHGEQNPEGGSSITLWGESMTVNELGDLLREFPQNSQIRVITNICYGGGLTELTSSNICVFANQQGHKQSVSESIDLDLYGQNFPYALKKKLDTDKDGKVTYWDAHQYATSLDDPENIPTTSLEWFLLKNKNKILEERSKKASARFAYGCENHPDDAIQQIANLIEDFDRMKVKITLSTEGIPSSRKNLLKGRLEKSIQVLKNKDASQLIEELDLKIEDLKISITESAKNWEKLSPQQQSAKRQKAQLEAQQIKTKLAQLEKDRRKYEILNYELDLLKFADETLIKEYSMIRKCLDYAY